MEASPSARRPQRPIDGMEHLHALVDEATNGQAPNGWPSLDTNYFTAYRFADSPYVGVGLAAPEEAHETLTLIDRLLSVTASRTHSEKTVRDVRHRIAGMAYHRGDAIADLANGDSDTARLARQVIFKTWSEREAATGLMEDVEQRWFDALCQDLPRAVQDGQRGVPASLQEERTERFADGLVRLGGVRRAEMMLQAVTQTIADPETQDAGKKMLHRAAECIGDTAPDDDIEKFAYKIHVHNFLQKLDRLTPLASDVTKSLIHELDEAGSEHDWNAILWDKIAEHVIDFRMPLENREAPASMLLGHYGLNYDQLLNDWSVGSGYAQSDYRFWKHYDKNLHHIVSLEQARPGAAHKLNAPPYRIRNFARVPLGALIAQADAIGKRGLSYGLVGLGLHENPEGQNSTGLPAHAPEAESPLWHGLHEAATEPGITLFFHEGDALQLIQALNTAVRRYGGSAEFAVAKFHNGDSPSIGAGSAVRDKPTQHDITELARGKRVRGNLRDAIKPCGELVLIACHAGNAGNTAETLHKLTGATVVGPNWRTNGFVNNHVTLIPRRRGGYGLDFQYATDYGTVSARRYS